MISGAHSIIYGKNPEADRAFLRDVFACGPVQDMGWGLLSQLTLPGGGKLGVYQPRHARPTAMNVKTPGKRTAMKRTPGKEPSKKSRRRQQ